MATRLPAFLRAGLSIYTLLLVLLIVPLTADPTGDSKTLLLHLGAGILGGAFLVGRVFGAVAFPARPIFFVPLLLFLLVNVIAAVFSDYVANTIPALTRLGALTLLYLAAAASVRTIRHARAWMITACAAVAISCLYALSQWAGLPPLPWDQAERSGILESLLTGTFGNVNYAGHAIVLCTILAAFLMSQPRMRWPALFLAIYAAQMALSVQRGALAALACAAILVTVGAFAVSRIRSVTGAVLATVAASAVSIICLALVVAAVLFAAGGASFQAPSLLLRYNAYAGASRITAEDPLTGVGPGNYVIVNPAYWTEFEQDWFVSHKLMNQHVHCDILEIGVNAGVPAAVLYLVFIVFGVGHGLYHAARFREDAEHRRLGLMFAAFFVAFFVDGVFGFDFYVPVPASFFFIILGCVEGIMADEVPSRVPSAPGRVAAALAAAGAVVLVVAAIRDYRGDMLMFEARRSMIAGQHEVADKLLERAEPLHSGNWLVPYHRGAAAQLDQRLDEARDHFARTLELNPYYVPAFAYLARLELAHAHEIGARSPDDARNAIQNAKSLAQRALQLAPGRPDDLDVLGRAYFLEAALTSDGGERNVRESWRKSYESLLTAARDSIHGADAELQMILGQSAEALGEVAAAERAYMRAVARLPAADAPYAQYFRFALRTQSLDRFAAVLASQIIETGPEPGREFAHRWLDRSISERAMDTSATWPIMLAAARRSPEDASSWLRLAAETRTAEQRRAFSEAVDSLLAKNESLPVPARILAMAWSGERSGLAGATKALVELQRGAPPLSDTVQQEIAKLAGHIEMQIRESTPDTPGLAVATINLAQVRAEMGQVERGAALLGEQYGWMDLPEQMLAAPQYAEMLIAAGHHQRAEDIVRELVALSPTQAELRVLLARVLARVDKKQEAYEEYALLLTVPNLDPATKALLESEQAALGVDKKGPAASLQPGLRRD